MRQIKLLRKTQPPLRPIKLLRKIQLPLRPIKLRKIIHLGPPIMVLRTLQARALTKLPRIRPTRKTPHLQRQITSIAPTKPIFRQRRTRLNQAMGTKLHQEKDCSLLLMKTEKSCQI